MLTGRQAFDGETVSDILASVLKSEADLSLLPAKLNPRIVDLLRRCLAKNPKDALARGSGCAGGDQTAVTKGVLVERRHPTAQRRCGGVRFRLRWACSSRV